MLRHWGERKIMIKENQKLFNRLNVLSDGMLIFFMLPVAFWIRFYVLPGGIISVPLLEYLVVDLFFTIIQLFSFASFGLYRSFRKTPLRRELARLAQAGALDMVLLLSFLFVDHGMHYSRWTLAIFFVLSMGALGTKRIALRRALRYFRQHGFNQKHVLILGSGSQALEYLSAIRDDRELGYQTAGYVARQPMDISDPPRLLGDFDQLDAILEQYRPDEVISALGPEDYQRTPQIIDACEKAGVKLSIIPAYAEYMTSRPQFDDLNGIPLMNIRRIPLDNWANAFCKRAMDVVGSALLLLLTSPVMLLCAIGVRLSSPGPVIFCQTRVGLNKRNFSMYKFRSMRVNDAQETGWSRDHDDRKTKFGAFMRKFSLDEFPQFWNVFKGDMSLVGPRPEVPYFVEQFREEVPLYMIKHQVRPGITGWAQVNDLRGDTSIKDRIEHDIYYIENWSVLFDLKILLMTVLKGKFVNHEALS